MSNAMTTNGAASPFLSLHNVTKRYGGTTALDAIDWDVRPGEVHCLVGENGSGKSTLIKVVAGVVNPSPGSRLVIDGSSHHALTPALSKAARIQVIYQDLSLFPNLSVQENIAFEHLLGAGAAPLSKALMRAEAQDALRRLDADIPLDALVGTLPIAQRQIVAICRGLTAQARLLFMDEPTASLTRHEVDLLLSVVRRLQAMGVAVVFVSHRLEEVVEIAERVTVLRDGRKVGTYPAAEIDNRRLEHLMTGDQIQHAIRAHDTKGRPPVLEATGLSQRGAFTDVSFALREGEVLGLTGLLGAGRTELALALFGMTQLDGGELRLDGKPLHLRSNRDAIAAGIAYLSEDRLTLGINLRQSISDNIGVAVLDKIAARSGLLLRARRAALARDWMDKLKIRAGAASAAAQTLSGGNQQRVVLAKWLATAPRVLILDSPTVGVDIRNKQGIYDIVRALADDGVSILLISDELHEVYHNADRVLHMRGGHLVGEYVPGINTEGQLHDAVYA